MRPGEADCRGFRATSASGLLMEMQEKAHLQSVKDLPLISRSHMLNPLAGGGGVLLCSSSVPPLFDSQRLTTQQGTSINQKK